MILLTLNLIYLNSLIRSEELVLLFCDKINFQEDHRLRSLSHNYIMPWAKRVNDHLYTLNEATDLIFNNVPALLFQI